MYGHQVRVSVSITNHSFFKTRKKLSAKDVFQVSVFQTQNKWETSHLGTSYFTRGISQKIIENSKNYFTPTSHLTLKLQYISSYEMTKFNDKLISLHYS